MPASGAPSATSLFSVLERRIPEIINNVLTQYLPGVDPAFNVIATSERIEGGIGRDLKVRKLFQGALSGVVEMDNPSAYPTLYGGTSAALGLSTGTVSTTLMNTSLTSYFPDPSKQIEPKPVELVVPIQALKGTLKMTLGELRLDALSGVIGEVVAPKLMGFVANIARTRCNMFYTADNTDYGLCLMTNIELGLGATHDLGRLVFTPDNECTNRFVRGMRVDLFCQTTNIGTSSASGNYDVKLNTVSGTAAATPSVWQTADAPCYVENVDYMADRVTLILASPSQFVNGALTANTPLQLNAATGNGRIKVCMAGTKFVAANGEAFSGLNTWIKKSGSIYGVDVEKFSEFKSLVYTDSGPLTEQKLRRIASRYNNAATQTHGFTIDTFISTQGVIDAYAATKIGEQQIQRAGSPLSLQNEGGVNKITFTQDGRSYTIEPSAWCDYGTLYGINRGGMRRFVPGRPADQSPLPGAPSFLEFDFVGKMLGFPGIRVPTPYVNGTSAAAVWSDTIQMPGESRMEVIPSQFPMVKVTGFTEDKLAGDYSTDLLANS